MIVIYGLGNDLVPAVLQAINPTNADQYVIRSLD